MLPGLQVAVASFVVLPGWQAVALSDLAAKPAGELLGFISS